jgi:hypothetical protein
MKLPLFQIASNPMVSDEKHIVSLRNPLIVAKVHTNQPDNFGNNKLITSNSYKGTVYYFEPIQIISDDMEKVESIMKRMAKWYVAYIVHINNNKHESFI